MMFENLTEFDKDYLESSAYGKYRGPYDRDYVGAFFTAMLPGLRQKLETAKAASPKGSQETVAYQRVITFLEFYLADAKPVPLPNVNDETYKEVFSHERIERFPEHKRWEAALVYMIMCLSNQIHTVITSIRGNTLPVPNGHGGWKDQHFAWTEESRVRELQKLEDLLKQVNDLTDDINEQYFPFTCG